jgi:thymidylate synthase (FAD)
MNREELLKKYSEPINVGSLGMVRLVDVMGDDSAIVQAARVSYGAGTKAVSEDTALIRYLMRHQHTSPFEMCEIKLHIKAPIHVMRQWIRHRTASVNETSTRYSVVQDDFEYFGELRLQAKDNKQGSSGVLEESTQYGKPRELLDWANDAIDNSFTEYNRLIGAGVAREQARNVLPLATYTECYWKIDLHNLFHFLRLRLDPHAQKEIRNFAQAIATILQDWVPNAYQAFVDYRLDGCYLSKQELEIIRSKLQGLAWDSAVDFTNLSKREQSEFLKKL